MLNHETLQNDYFRFTAGCSGKARPIGCENFRTMLQTPYAAPAQVPRDWKSITVC
jgi:hypothetical protein